MTKWPVSARNQVGIWQQAGAPASSRCGLQLGTLLFKEPCKKNLWVGSIFKVYKPKLAILHNPELSGCSVSPQRSCRAGGDKLAESTSKRARIPCTSCPALGPREYLCHRRGLRAVTQETLPGWRGNQHPGQALLPTKSTAGPAPTSISTAIARSPSRLFHFSRLSLLWDLGNPVVTIFRLKKKSKRFVSLACKHPGISIQYKQFLETNPSSRGEEHDVFFPLTRYASNFLGKPVLYHTPVTLWLLEIFVSLNPTQMLSAGKGKPHSTFSWAVTALQWKQSGSWPEFSPFLQALICGHRV